MDLNGLDLAQIAAIVGVMLAAGVGAGILAGLLGVGGGIIVVPVLFQVFTIMGVDEAIRMQMAVGTSLACIIPTAISSARSHYKRGSVDLELLKSLGIGVIIGVAIGSYLASIVRGPVLSGIFGVVAILAALNMALRPEGWQLRQSFPTGIAKYVIGIVIGTISSMMGIGGGTLTVPTLSACNVPVRRAVGTSAAVGLVIALPGTVGFITTGFGVEGTPFGSIGFMNLIGFACIVPTMILSAPLGAKIAHTIPPKWLGRAFATFLFIVGARMLHSLIF